MTFLCNAGGFFAVFLPLTFVVSAGLGLLAGPAVGDGAVTTATPFPLMQWSLSVLLVVLPTLVLVPLLHWLRRRGMGRAPLAVVTPLAFVGLIFVGSGLEFASWPVALFTALPAAAYGALLRAPVRPPAVTL